MGRAQASYALMAPDGALLGCVCFGLPGGTRAGNVCGPEFGALAICLERGACVHYAPRNAASFLIQRAVRLASQAHGWAIFYAYADPSAGELGVVYQAAGWHYLGQGVGRTTGTRDLFLDPDGRGVSSRTLRHRRLKKTAALAMGWAVVDVPQKHKYVTFAGPRADEMRAACRYPFLAYPKRAQEKPKPRSRGVPFAGEAGTPHRS